MAKKTQDQETVEMLLKRNGSKQTYAQWRAHTLHNVALDLIEGAKSKYEDAVISVAVSEMMVAELKKERPAAQVHPQNH